MTTFGYTGLFDKHPNLKDVMSLIEDDSMSMMIESNNTFLLTEEIMAQAYHTHMDQFIEFKPDSFINLKYEEEEFLPIYYIHTNTRKVYYIDCRKIKYSFYEHVFQILDYITQPSKIVIQNKALIIINNIECILTKYVTRLCKYIENPNPAYYFLFLTNRLPNCRNSIWGKLAAFTHKIIMNLNYEQVQKAIESNYNMKLIQKKIGPKLLFRVFDTCFRLFAGDVAKMDIFVGHILTKINDDGEEINDKNIYHTILSKVPVIKLVGSFICQIKRLKQITDLEICYDMAYKFNSFNYSPKYVFNSIIILLTSRLPLGDFLSLKPMIRDIIQLASETEALVLKDETDYIVQYQNFFIGLAQLLVR